jgi:hypothetical protein
MVLSFGDLSRRREIMNHATYQMAKKYLDYQTQMRGGEATGPEPTTCPAIVQQFCQGRLTGQCKTCLGG